MRKQKRILTAEQQRQLRVAQLQFANGKYTFLQYHLALYSVFEPDLSVYY